MRYNGYTLPNVFDKFTFTTSYRQASLSCQFLIKGTSEVDLVSRCHAAENALREWNKDFTLIFSSSSEYDFSHSDNTGFLAQPSLKVIPNRLQTGTSRAYSFSLSMQLPADQSGYNYRQEGNISLSQDIKGRKILTISGKYTAGGSNSARDNYDAYANAWMNSIAAGFGTYEKLYDSSQTEQEDKILSFNRRYQEKLNLAVTYNNYTIPGDYANFTFNETYTTLSMSFEFKISHADATSAETALRIFNKDLVISFNGNSVYSYEHSSNSGLLTRPSLRKISNKSHTDTTDRFYSFSISCQLPADSPGYNYRREGNVRLSYSGSRRRTVLFSGAYTAGGANTALQNYQANARTWASAFLSAFGGDYELVQEASPFEMEDKICNFSLTYRELLTKDSKANTDEPAIVNANCSYQVNLEQKIGIATDYAQIPLTTITVNYSAEISKDLVVQDTSVEDVYRGKVRPWIVEHSFLVLGLDNYGQAGQNYIIQAETWNINPHNYTVSGMLSFTALQNLFQIIDLSERVSIMDNDGITFQKLWDGQPDTYNVYKIGRTRRLRRVVTVTQMSIEPRPPKDLSGGYIRLSNMVDGRVEKIGVGSVGTLTGVAQELELYTYSYIQEYLWVRATSSGVNSGGGGYYDPRAD